MDLASYPAFRYLRILRTSRFFSSDQSIQLLVVLLIALCLCAGSASDSTLLLEGPNVGLLEHPTILAFLLAQYAVFGSVWAALASLRNIDRWGAEVVAQSYLVPKARTVQRWIRQRIRRRTPASRTYYRLLQLVGFAVFAWNSFQNQQPYRLVGFDFWDSALHVWGYWCTRAFKLYFWVMFIPAVTHAQTYAVLGVSGLLQKAAAVHELGIKPLHHDGCGGARGFVDMVISPLTPSAIVASLMLFSSVSMHGKLDPTTVGAGLLFIVALLAVYVMPSVVVRDAIVSEKRRQRSRITDIHASMLSSLLNVDSLSSKDALPDLASRLQTLEYLRCISDQIGSVSDWPRLGKAWQMISITASSPVLAMALTSLRNWLSQN